MLFVKQIFHDMTASDEKAKSNSLDRFYHPCNDALMDFVVERTEKNDRFSTKILDNETFAKIIKDILFPAVYEYFKKTFAE